MFEAYKVAVKVSLKNEVTAGLLGLSSQFKILGKDAEAFQKKINTIKKAAMVGAGIGAAGFFGLDIMSKMIKPAEEYAHILNIMNIQGLKHQEIAEAVSAAWKTTNTVITSTVSGNLKNFIDLKNIFRGNVQEAISYLPEFAKLAAVLGASSNAKVSGNSHDLAFSVAKALDIRGAVNPSEFKTESEMMAKVIIATQGRVLPQDYQMLAKYSRQSLYGASNKFLYTELPTLMLEQKTAGGGGGGGSNGGFGVPMNAAYRFFVQGIMTKVSHERLSELGLLSGSKYNDALKTTTTRTILRNGVAGASLFQSDPITWVQQYLVPALHREFGKNITKAEAIRAISSLRMSGTGSYALLQYYLKYSQIEGDANLIARAKNLNTAYKMSLSNDPNTVNLALSSQWNKLKLAFSMGIIPILLPTIMKLTTEFQKLGNALRAHPALAKKLALGIGSLFVSMIALGGALLTVSVVLNPITRSLLLLGTAFTGLALLLPTLINGVKWWGNEIEKFFHILPNNSSHGFTNMPSQVGFIPPPHVLGDLAHNFFQNPVPVPLEIHTYVHIDSKEIAHTVTRAQGKAASRQPNHGSVYNPNIGLQPNMLNYGNSF
jgi:hypothetical protein